MRVALLHPFVWPEVRRGAERYVDDLGWYLQGQGHEVHVVASTTDHAEVTTTAAGVVVHRCRLRGSRWLGKAGIDPVAAFGLATLPTLRRERFDVVHAMVPAAAVAARLAGTPAVFSFIGHPTRGHLAGAPAADRALYRTAARRTDVTAALSRASARAVADLFGREPVVLPPGVRTGEFPLRGEARTGPPRILFSATPADRRKRLDLVLAAMDLVLDEHPDARLSVSGSGDPTWAFATLAPDRRARVRRATDQLGTGEPGDLPARYQEATVVALPAVDEAFGIVVVEALASGTPVVVSDDAGMVDIVDRPGVGRTFPAGDARACADALIDAITLSADPATPSTCAEHASRWDWSTSIGPRHEAVYGELVAG